MNYFTEPDKLIKSIAVGDQDIMVADNFFATPEELSDYLLSGKKKWIDTALQFPYTAITRILLFDSDNCIQLLVSNKGKQEKVPVAFSSRADYTWLLELVKARTGLEPLHSKLPDGKKIAKIKNYLIVLAVAILSTALAGIAYEQEQGKHINISGSKRGMKRIMVQLADVLGFYGSLAAGAVVTLAVLYFLILRNKRIAPDGAA